MNTLGKNGKPFLFIINYHSDGNFVWEPHEIIPDEILFKLHNFTNIPAGTRPEYAVPVSFKKYPLPYSVYEKSFQQFMQHLEHGNSYLVNLTFPTDIETNLKLEDFFHHADTPYKLLLKNNFVVFSPETFVRISGNKISSFPMKGTIDASIPDAGNIILKDPKEKAEHVTIVDLIRNDLSMISRNVKVTSLRQISKIRTREKDLFQASLEITGEISEDFFKTLGTSFFKLLPAGSICGSPKKRLWK